MLGQGRFDGRETRLAVAPQRAVVVARGGLRHGTRGSVGERLQDVGMQLVRHGAGTYPPARQRLRRLSPNASIGLCNARPPSHSKTWPVAHSTSWSARIACATSSGRPRRARAVRSCTAASQPDSVGARPSIGVSVTPGPTAFTRMPYGPHSHAATWTIM